MALSTETREALQERRCSLAAQLQDAGDTASPRELRDLQYLARQVDSLLKLQGAPAGDMGPDGAEHLARLCKSERAELRVSLREWKGQKRVELRQWYLPIDGSDWLPKQRGIGISARHLDAVIEALQLAKESLRGALPDA